MKRYLIVSMQQQLQHNNVLLPVIENRAMRSKNLRSITAHLLAYIAPTNCVGCRTALFSYNRFMVGIPLCSHCAKSISFITEPRCNRCGIPLLSEQQLCLRCREIPNASYTNRSLCEYYGVVRDLIHHYKFKRCCAIASLFAPFLVQLWQQEYRGITVVPVPSSPRNIKKRGWDQIHLLLKEMQHYQKIPSISPLQRQRGTSQKQLSRSQRLENAQELFVYHYHKQLPRRIVLLDDIYTTGATLESCAALLHAHGVQKIYGLTVAIDL